MFVHATNYDSLATGLGYLNHVVLEQSVFLTDNIVTKTIFTINIAIKC